MEYGASGDFYEKIVESPNFTYVAQEVERSEAVILLLGFWQNQTIAPGIWEWKRVGGHYVTVAGVDSEQNQIALSDPVIDNAELGYAGRVRPQPHPPGHNATLHNNASYVSHDIYTVLNYSDTPGGLCSIPDYPAETIVDLVGENGPVTGEYNYTLPVYTEVEYAVIISPMPSTEPSVHDVAITNITPSSGIIQVYPNWTIPINMVVTVTNEGDYHESFYVTAYYGNNTIETKHIHLSSRHMAPWLGDPVTDNLTFINISGISVGTYILSARADVVSSEADTADNVKSNGVIRVHHPGDVDGDGFVGGYDAAMIGIHWWTDVGDPNYGPRVDFDGDGFIGGYDATIISIYWWTNVPKP